MSKNLILLSDGTGQRGGVGYETNVWRLNKALVTNDQKQLICYDDGVGSERSRIKRIMGGMSAVGLDQNVRELYSFLVRHWEPGDRIYLFGFSRGAFTVRILSDMISRCGVIPMHHGEIESEARLEKLIKVAYAANMKAYYRPSYARAFGEQEKCDNTVQIQFIGVWDTVGAIGLPFAQLRYAMHNRMEYGFRGHALNKKVLHAAHAMSIDDCRETFHPVVWDERIDSNPERIAQVWFSGVHTNVGGGYPKNQLSLVTLDWMIDQVRSAETKAGLPPSERLQFEPTELENISREKDPHGRLYDSRSGLASAYRFLPRDLEEIRQTYTKGEAKIHPAVFDRIEQNTDGYSPHNLADKVDSERMQTTPVETLATWGECMSAAKTYSYWQQFLYHLFMLPIVLVVLLLLWKIFLNALDALPFWTISPQGLFGPFTSATELFVYVATGGVIFTVSLIASELCQIRFRKRQHRIASQGWCTVFPSCRIDDKALLAKTKSSSSIKISGAPQKCLEFYKGLVTVTIYVFVYTLGIIYQAPIRFTAWHRLKEIKKPESGLVHLDSGQVAELFFETSMHTMHTGLLLQQGKKYHIWVDKASGWFDASLPATPDGLKRPVSAFMKMSQKYSRQPKKKIFTLLGEIDKGEPFPIVSKPPHSCDQDGFPIVAETAYSCDRDGELVLYVNDVRLLRDILYLNNRGAARILVELA